MNAHWQAFVELFRAIPRQGPGSREATLRALALLSRLPAAPRVIDAGSGSGASTFVLAEALPRATILAVDLEPSLLALVRDRAAKAGLTERIEARRQSMEAIAEPPASVDLVWSEGALYSVGIRRGLDAWRLLLRPGGHVVFSELCWFVEPERRPVEVVEYMTRGYAAMRDEAGVAEVCEAAGFSLLGRFRLADEDWWTSLYTPLVERCRGLEADADPVMREVIDEVETEIDMFRRFSTTYGYTYFALRLA